MTKTTDFPTAQFVETNGVRLAVYEQGSGEPIILLHGFPELAYSWRYQMAALADAGYRVIAIDQRGYGPSSKPTVVTDYDITHLTGDVCGVLDHFGIDKAVICGRDWGAIVTQRRA